MGRLPTRGVENGLAVGRESGGVDRSAAECDPLIFRLRGRRALAAEEICADGR